MCSPILFLCPHPNCGLRHNYKLNPCRYVRSSISTLPPGTPIHPFLCQDASLTEYRVACDRCKERWKVQRRRSRREEERLVLLEGRRRRASSIATATGAAGAVVAAGAAAANVNVNVGAGAGTGEGIPGPGIGAAPAPMFFVQGHAPLGQARQVPSEPQPQQPQIAQRPVPEISFAQGPPPSLSLAPSVPSWRMGTAGIGGVGEHSVLERVTEEEGA